MKKLICLPLSATLSAPVLAADDPLSPARPPQSTKFLGKTAVVVGLKATF